MKYFEVGGQEVVTNVLAGKFVQEGHHVIIVSFHKPSQMMLEQKSQGVKLYTLNGFSASNENIRVLRDIFIKHKINVVINQWGLPYIPIRTARKAGEKLKIKYISVYHNDPSKNARTQDIENELNKNNANIINKCILSIKYHLFKKITQWSMYYVYKESDIYMVLSQSHIESFKKFIGIRNPIKLRILTNPITTNQSVFSYNPEKKEKKIIYVGRIDYNQKRVHRIIDTWSLLEERNPEWSLIIVGDGSERMNIENQVKILGLKNISFEGFQNPVEYYNCASILLLTSEFEGFPLVIAESMSFGVAPVVYGSYSAVYDIIDDGIDGFIIPKDKNGFTAEKMATKIEMLINNFVMRSQMAQKAIEKSKDYSLDKIYSSWKQYLEY